MFLRRPGGQTQFSPLLMAPTSSVARLAALLEWIPGHLGDDLSIDALAAQAHMTPRTLCRLFSQETGIGPGQYIERVRLEAARNLLLDAPASIATVARLTGFGHPENLRRSFQKHLSVRPRDIYKRFGCRYRPHSPFPARSASGQAALCPLVTLREPQQCTYCSPIRRSYACSLPKRCSGHAR